MRLALAHFFPFLPSSFLSFLPPLSISRCPAFCANIFSVCATRPALLLCLILFCEMMLAFLGLMTRAPGLGPVREGLMDSSQYTLNTSADSGRGALGTEGWAQTCTRIIRCMVRTRTHSLSCRYGLGLCLDCALGHDDGSPARHGRAR